MNTAAQKLLTQYYLKPNFNSGSTTRNYRTLLPLNNSTDGFDIRIDQSVGSKHLIYGRWIWKNIFFLSAANPGLAQLLPPVTDNEKNRNLLVGDSYTFTPALPIAVQRTGLINEFRFGYSELTTDQSLPFSGTSVVANLGSRLTSARRAGWQ